MACGRGQRRLGRSFEVAMNILAGLCLRMGIRTSTMVGTSSYVNVWVGTERKEAIAIPTNGNGVARLQLTLNTGEINIPNSSKDRGSIVADHPVVNYNESLRINTPYVLCGSGGPNYSWLRSENFSTKDILQHGYVSPNTCGKATVSLQPGQLILFVRPLTWWEKLKHVVPAPDIGLYSNAVSIADCG